MSFGVLKMAQALGDLQALRDAGRGAIRLHLEGDIPSQIERLRATIARAGVPAESQPGRIESSQPATRPAGSRG